MSVKVNEKAYIGLVEAFCDTSKVKSAADKAKRARDGQYNKLVASAALCKSAAEWDATDDRIQHNITHNVDGLGEKVQAEEREKPSESGAKYTMPRSITNALAVLRFAWHNNVPLTAKNKKTGKVEHVSLGSLRKARENKLAADELVKAQALTGVAKVRFECAQMIAKIGGAVEKVPDDTIQGIHSALALIIEAMAPKAQQAQAAQQDVGEQLKQAA